MSICLLIILFFSPFARSAIELPVGLNKTNREQTLKLLGMGTSSKILSDPYPLGGYPGLEVSASMEFLDLSDMSNLGTTTLPLQNNISYPRFTVGKGTYDNLDIFIHFTPFDKSIGISEFGGVLRWGIYQATYLPSSLSIVAHANRANIRNTIFTNSRGIDLVAGFSLSQFSLYFGGGSVSSSGQFIVGSASATSITETSDSAIESVSGLHTLMGVTLNLKSFFIAAELDRYAETTISAKVGIRN